MKTEYIEISLDTITRNLVKHFELPKGMGLVSYETFVDLSKNKIVLKLVSDEKNHIVIPCFLEDAIK